MAFIIDCRTEIPSAVLYLLRTLDDGQLEGYRRGHPENAELVKIVEREHEQLDALIPGLLLDLGPDRANRVWQAALEIADHRTAVYGQRVTPAETLAEAVEVTHQLDNDGENNE